MNLTLPLHSVTSRDKERIGGKAYALSVLAREGANVPRSLCVTVHACREYLKATKLRQRISQELNRKRLSGLLREETWDLSLRIRSMFMNTAMPADLRHELKQAVDEFFGGNSVVIYPSSTCTNAPHPWTAGFRGEYENISGAYPILDRIRFVWASVYADSALELPGSDRGLSSMAGSMAVLIQETVQCDAYGTAFSASPEDNSRMIIECYPGKATGLPCPPAEHGQWVLDRATGVPLVYRPSDREEQESPASGERSCLMYDDISRVYGLATQAEHLLGAPQEVDWACRAGRLFILDSRPMNRMDEGVGQRPWDLVLKGCYEGIGELRDIIASRLLPRLISEADAFSKTDVQGLKDSELAEEIEKRFDAHRIWEGVYREKVVLFAYGMALFGRIYNEALRPADPYEFMELLPTPDLPDFQKNRLLEKMAALVRSDSKLRMAIKMQVRLTGFNAFMDLLSEFCSRFGGPCSLEGDRYPGQEAILKLVLELAEKHKRIIEKRSFDITGLTDEFLESIPHDRKSFSRELLGFAREGCRLQSEAGIHIRRIGQQMEAALAAGRKRLKVPGIADAPIKEVVCALKHRGYLPAASLFLNREGGKKSEKLSSRRLLGRPAGRGIVTGRARVVREEHDILKFKAGEIMVCSTLEPDMTCVVPLADAIVAEKGSMFNQGGIMAWGYGLPYVAGVNDATMLIRTGDKLTVNGYLGVVIIRQ